MKLSSVDCASKIVTKKTAEPWRAARDPVMASKGRRGNLKFGTNEMLAGTAQRMSSELAVSNLARFKKHLGVFKGEIALIYSGHMLDELIYVVENVRYDQGYATLVGQIGTAHYGDVRRVDLGTLIRSVERASWRSWTAQSPGQTAPTAFQRLAQAMLIDAINKVPKVDISGDEGHVGEEIEYNPTKKRRHIQSCMDQTAFEEITQLFWREFQMDVSSNLTPPSPYNTETNMTSITTSQTATPLQQANLNGQIPCPNENVLAENLKVEAKCLEKEKQDEHSKDDLQECRETARPPPYSGEDIQSGFGSLCVKDEDVFSIFSSATQEMHLLSHARQVRERVLTCSSEKLSTEVINMQMVEDCEPEMHWDSCDPDVFEIFHDDETDSQKLEFYVQQGGACVETNDYIASRADDIREHLRLHKEAKSIRLVCQSTAREALPKLESFGRYLGMHGVFGIPMESSSDSNLAQYRERSLHLRYKINANLHADECLRIKTRCGKSIEVPMKHTISQDELRAWLQSYYQVLEPTSIAAGHVSKILRESNRKSFRTMATHILHDALENSP